MRETNMRGKLTVQFPKQASDSNPHRSNKQKPYN